MSSPEAMDEDAGIEWLVPTMTGNSENDSETLTTAPPTAPHARS